MGWCPPPPTVKDPFIRRLKLQKEKEFCTAGAQITLKSNLRIDLGI